jgi:cytoskeletal protein CcmA (bactofilin family)
VALVTVAMFVGLVAPAAADGVALGAGNVNVIDESNTPAEGPVVTIANTMRIAQTQHFEVLPEETYAYDLYIWTQSMDIMGTLDGDLFVGGQSVTIDGTVTEDVMCFAENLTITGRVGDDVRAFAQTIRISGVVDGDVLIGSANLLIEEGAVINGSLLVGAGTVTLHGHVKGSVRIGAGAVTMTGRIDGNTEIYTDGGLTISDRARIGGDLVYEGPKELELEEGIVQGSVTFTPPKEETSTKFSFGPMFGLAIHIFEFFAAIIAGVLIVAFTKDHARKTANKIRTRPMKSLGIGFVAYICIPIVLLITLVLIITIPFCLVLGLAYLIALYIAKFYFSIWLGSWILRRGDRIMTASPIPPMLLGLVIVYLLTAIPVLGTLIGIVIIFFGLGALLQRKETRLETAFEPVEPVDQNALPSVFPGTTEG